MDVGNFHILLEPSNGGVEIYVGMGFIHPNPFGHGWFSDLDASTVMPHFSCPIIFDKPIKWEQDLLPIPIRQFFYMEYLSQPLR